MAKKYFNDKIHLLQENDLYKILEVESDISEEDLEKRYKLLEKQLHPSNYTFILLSSQESANMSALFGKISGAYNTLKNPWTRKKYDELRDQSEERAFSNEDTKEDELLTNQYKKYLKRFSKLFQANEDKPFKDKLNIINESNLYTVLGVESSISHEELQKHFKELEKKYNPTKFSFVLVSAQDYREMNMVYNKIVSAFKVLKNKELRESYDKTLEKGI